MKREIISISALILLLGTAQVARATLVDSNSIVKDGVEYYLRTDKFVYDLGEDVVMLYRVTNLTENTIDLGEALLQPYCYWFSVRDDDNDEIWYWPISGPIGSSPNFVLSAYESREHETTWDMTEIINPDTPNVRYPVDSGLYTIVGHLQLRETEKIVPVSVSIEIIPEPTTIVLLGAGFIGIILGKKGRYVR